jgi:L-aminopeptidase/D-esterase-like protein
LAAAIAVVHAFGDVRDGDGRIIAGQRTPSGDFADAQRLLRGVDTPTDSRSSHRMVDATLLALVAVSVPLSKMQLAQVATAARVLPTHHAVRNIVRRRHPV